MAAETIKIPWEYLNTTTRHFHKCLTCGMTRRCLWTQCEAYHDRTCNECDDKAAMVTDIELGM